MTYINMCRYHYILLIINVDSARVHIMDSLDKPEEEYQLVIDALQR